MNRYRFSLKDYHAISSADIILDGLTVIAGENGCGKSTIARWLYYFVTYANEFDHLIDANFTRTLRNRLSAPSNILHRLSMTVNDNQLRKELRRYGSASFYQLPAPSTEDTDTLLRIFKNKMEDICAIMQRIVQDPATAHLANWIRSGLRVDSEVDLDQFIDIYLDRTMQSAYKMANLSAGKKRQHMMSDLIDFIRQNEDFDSDAPTDMSLEEAGMPLISDTRFITPINLSRAILIDTPMALSNKHENDDHIWGRLMTMMDRPRGPMPESGQKLAVRLRRIIGGTVIARDNDMTISHDIRYVRRDDNLDIPIDEAATGLRSFAYMLRLLENGYLDDTTLLLIDEPEAHLHPQWIVEFARILVLLQKEVGTKVLVSSHNPDMVAALRTIALAEEMGDRTHFYQAERVADTLKYDYVDLGTDIEQIFRSFNIALTRIDQYGER